jgi:hypothetical protein
MRTRGRHPATGRASIGTGIVLIALGAVLAVAVRPPEVVEEYVDVLDLGLVLVWAGVLVLVMQVVMNRPRRPRGRGPLRDRAYDPDRTDKWYEHDVHRPGYAGQTRRLPTVRDRD